MSNNPIHSPNDTIKIAPRPLSRLTYKILSLNIVTVAVLAMSFSYLAQTRENLISNEINNFETETRLYAAALKKMLPNIPHPSFDETLLDLNFHPDQQVLLFDSSGQLLSTNGIIPLRRSYIEIQDKELNPMTRGLAAIENSMSVNFNLPPFPGAENLLTAGVPKIQQTVDGLNIAAWSAPDGGLILSAGIRLFLDEGKVVTLQLVRRDLQIEKAFSETRIDVLRFSIFSLVITVSLSLYLAGFIGHPLRNLATAAEAFRINRGRGVVIPDMSSRNDEIGELSKAMQEMASALQDRLDAIERFAADVAHELKNPLSSVKSAVETLPKVRNDADRARLTEIIHHDLHRMDRLISDISQASRLDAELSRDTLEPLDIRNILNPLLDAKKNPMDSDEDKQIIRKGFYKPVLVLGQGGRLAQVFDNLISNALSFSPNGEHIIVTIEEASDHAKITIDDNGVGIPESRLEKIFDRFYSERPVSESFGMHSGLGLSIAKQIVESLGGSIHAENRRDEMGNIVGARFVVRLRVPAL